MYLSDEENKKFSGSGEKNGKGKTLDEFVRDYDPSVYENPSCTADMAVFIYDDAEVKKCIPDKDMKWKLLLIKRGDHPSIGQWAMPGGFVELGEDTSAAAARELSEETGVKDVLPVQVRSFSDPGRDPRTHIVTTLYAAALPEGSVTPQAGDDANDTGIFEVRCDVFPLEKEELLNEDFSGVFDTSDPSKKMSPYREYLRKKVSHDPESVSVDKVELTFTEEERGIVLKAVLLRAQEKAALLKDVFYILKKSEGIAMDHGCVMAYAYEFIKNSFDQN